ncbi:MAG: hypothetical protein SOW51_08270, partial [Oscillospiraceae bacterium]|jgi:hypothetical protein|nr:hypothetical protein [Oscillospiraceae bacterium]
MRSQETNRERFIRIAEARTQKIIDMIDLLGNCSNQYNYEYTQKDVDKMFAAIETALKTSKSKFSSEKTNKETRFKF